MDVRTGNIYETTVQDGPGEQEKGTGDTNFKLDGDNCTRYCRLASKFNCICIEKKFRSKCKQFSPKRGFRLVKKGDL